MESTSFQGLLDELNRTLSPERFLHVLGVTHMAVQLAFRHGLDPGLAALAGLVHDRSKFMSPETIEADLRRRGVQIPDEDRPYPAIWHGLHAAVWLRQDAALVSGTDLDSVAEAVEFHSTSNAGLGAIGRLLFVSDYLEPGRRFDAIDQLRRTSMQSLEEGYQSCLAAKCRYVLRKGRGKLHPRAFRAMQEQGLKLEDEVGTGPQT